MQDLDRIKPCRVIAESKRNNKALNPALTGDICGEYCFVKDPFRVTIANHPF